MKTVIQIGANVGCDHIQQFYDNGYDVILVEANPMHIDGLNKRYPNATVIWSAVVPGGLLGKATPIFYSVDDAPLYNKATTDIHHLLRYGYSLDSIRVVTAPCLVLADLLAMRRQGVDIIF